MSEKLVLDNDMCGMAQRFKRGIEPRADTLAIDAIKQGLEEGDFLTTEDTLRLYKEETFYPSSIIDRKACREEGPIPATRLVEEASRQIEKRLAAYSRPAIGDSQLQDMKDVMTRALSAHGLEDLAEKCLSL